MEAADSTSCRLEAKVFRSRTWRSSAARCGGISSITRSPRTSACWWKPQEQRSNRIADTSSEFMLATVCLNTQLSICLSEWWKFTANPKAEERPDTESEICSLPDLSFRCGLVKRSLGHSASTIYCHKDTHHQPAELVTIIKDKSIEFGLEPDKLWDVEIPHILQWANDWLHDYKQRRMNG